MTPIQREFFLSDVMVVLHKHKGDIHLVGLWDDPPHIGRNLIGWTVIDKRPEAIQYCPCCGKQKSEGTFHNYRGTPEQYNDLWALNECYEQALAKFEELTR